MTLLSMKGRLVVALGSTAMLIALAAWMVRSSGELRAYALGLEFALLAGLLITFVACLVAIPLGALSASGPRFFDTLLRFICDSVSSLPTLFVAAVFWVWCSSTLGYVCAIGVLRGLEQSWLLRCEIVRLEAEDPESVPHGLGRTPLAAFLRMRLPAALGPLLVSASFSIAWFTALDAGLTHVGLRPHRAPTTWGLALGAAQPNPLVALLAAGSLVWLTAALHALFRRARPANSQVAAP